MKLKSLFAGLGLLGAISTAQAALGALDTVPGATLLAPFFEVDVNSSTGLSSQITVSNAGSSEQVARVTLWSERGVPVFAFDIRLAARGTSEVNLRSLLMDGALPASTAGGVSSCSGVLPYAALSAAQAQGLRDALTGRPSTLLGGQCASSTGGNAKGFVTIDAVNGCTAGNTVSPASVGYFVAGGTGVASNANVLFGDYSFVNPSSGIAYGDALVSLEAGVASGDTFYGLMSSNGAANGREALPFAYSARFSRVEGTFPNTINDTGAIVWRDPGFVAPYACSSSPPTVPDGIGTVFDNREQPIGPIFNTTYFALAAQRFSSVTPLSAGHIIYDLRTTANPTRQAFVSHIFYTNGFGAANSAEASMSPATSYSGGAAIAGTPVPTFGFDACSDGIDNDGDGLADFPADPGCESSLSGTENPACSDGIDNDSDTLTDFPADPSCLNRFGALETTECSDGLDQDGDMAIDFPADNGCRSLADQSEFNNNNQCSDGVDNNGDGRIDFPADPTCFFSNDSSEGTVACNDGIDNDGDMLVDFPADTGCFSAIDTAETAEQCSDGIDNDSDGRIDFPNDPGCVSLGDNQEANPACIDGIDNDADGLIDFPQDPGCSSANDVSENFGPCDDGFDNDGDTLIDFPNDPGCASAQSPRENPQCNNTFDDDFDGLVDFPADPQCSSASSDFEQGNQCNDGIDNDSDGLIDFPASPNCTSATDPSELPECRDGVDNDSDGLADFTGAGSLGADLGCSSADDASEFASISVAACSDGQDNDGDGFIDFPADPGCTGAGDINEFAANQVQGAVGHPIPALSVTSLLVLLLGLVGLAGLALHRRQ